MWNIINIFYYLCDYICEMYMLLITLEQSGTHYNSLDQTRSSLEMVWNSLGMIWDSLGMVWDSLGIIWDSPEVIWTVLASWEHY